MSVVTRLCGKMEPNDPSLDFCVDTLSKLLKHEDNFVADGALRCFASLSDRFTRKGVDPEPLARYGLIEELIRKLGDSVMANNTNKWSSDKNPVMTNLATPKPPAPTDAADALNKSSAVVSISTLTGLLSALCRSSHVITKEILESNILDSIEKAMYGDERCVLDTMRFLDLLLTLIFEGRDALPKTSYTAKTTGGLMAAKNEASEPAMSISKPPPPPPPPPISIRYFLFFWHMIKLFPFSDLSFSELIFGSTLKKSPPFSHNYNIHSLRPRF